MPADKTRERLDLIYETIERIPAGKVATYGQIAGICGLPGRARLVGRAMRILPSGSAIPWYRVINSSGRSSLPEGEPAATQRALLEDEGVRFENGRVDLKKFRWSEF